jgi:hypothetical protein
VAAGVAVGVGVGVAPHGLVQCNVSGLRSKSPTAQTSFALPVTP